ncbi:MAG: alpha-L-fucosidase [Bacteroidota bacterium]
MKKLLSIVLVIISTSLYAQNDYLNESQEEYQKRLHWFTESKYGMFIHFGLYSQLGGVWEGKEIEHYAEWIQANADIPKEEYTKLISTWNPEKFNATKIARLAKKAGMKYLVVTTKHHEGFCLWDSKFTKYDIASTPVKDRDFVRELADACKKQGIRFGTYYSIIDWHHPSQSIIKNDETGKGIWNQPVMLPGKKPEYVQYMKNQIRELIDNYDTDILWFDGDWANWWTVEDGNELYQYIRELKPEIIINNRVSKREEFKKDFGTPEQFHPDDSLDYLWEACYTMNSSWGFCEHDNQWKSPQTVYDKLKDINGKEGNLLLNIGPDGNGIVPKESVKILLEVGKMLNKK